MLTKLFYYKQRLPSFALLRPKHIFMKKTIFALFAVCCLLSCNKDSTEFESPPFSAYPNPFVSVLGLQIRPSLGTQTYSGLKVLDGTDKAIFDSGTIMPGDNLQIDMSKQKKGIYYVELKSSDNTYTLSVLKTE